MYKVMTREERQQDARKKLLWLYSQGYMMSEVARFMGRSENHVEQIKQGFRGISEKAYGRLKTFCCAVMKREQELSNWEEQARGANHD